MTTGRGSGTPWRGHRAGHDVCRQQRRTGAGVRRRARACHPRSAALLNALSGFARRDLRTSSEELWSAWRHLADVEDRVAGLGSGLGPDLIVLWAVWRFGGTALGEPMLKELVDDDYQLRLHDPMVEDMVLVAFALGAGWGAEVGW